MTISHDFLYFKPKSMFEAASILNKYGNKAELLAGGTDLIVYLKENRSTPEALIDIKGLSELKNIEVKNNNLIIGAGVTFSEIIESQLIKEHFPLLIECSETVASNGVRNRATLVGNICSAVPSLDSAPALLVYNAVVNLVSSSATRSVPIDNWFLAPRKTARTAIEIVTSISLPLINTNTGYCYTKLGRYAGEDLAQSGLGILILPNYEYRIAHCALAPKAARSYNCEQVLQGKPISNDTILLAQNALLGDISPISDIRSSKEYRLITTKVMLERGLQLAWQRFTGQPVCKCNILGGGL